MLLVFFPHPIICQLEIGQRLDKESDQEELILKIELIKSIQCPSIDTTFMFNLTHVQENKDHKHL